MSPPVVTSLCVLVLFSICVCSLQIHNHDEEAREPIILIPGFASSRLMAWKQKKCGSGFNINIGDRVWIDASQVLYDSFREGCWAGCMMLNDNQTDPIDCKLRPVSSIEAIGELDPGQITGPLSSIFRPLIDLLVGDFDYDTKNLAASPYDWRLPPSMLEERDSYFTSMKFNIEKKVAIAKQPAMVIAHSMGNNVFQYFTQWIKKKHPLDWQEWFDGNISTVFEIAAPLLGSPKAVRMAISGDTFGLPLSEASVSQFMKTFGSGPWMLPLEDPSPTNLTMRPPGGWPYHPVGIDYHATHESKNYTVANILDGTLFNDLARYDVGGDKVRRIIEKYYKGNEINALIPPERPPVQNVYCLYGINEPTEAGYQYRIVDDEFRLKKSIWEVAGGEVYSTTALLARKRKLPASSWGKSGDGTVTYNSLSWCQTWHTGEVKTSEIPTIVDTSSRVHGLKTLLGMQSLIHGKHRFDSESIEDGRIRRTSVVEFERQNHRDIILSRDLIQFLREELEDRVNIEYQPYKRGQNIMETIEKLEVEELELLLTSVQQEIESREKQGLLKEQPKEEIPKREKIGEFIGNNESCEEIEVIHVRDDDEGSEFKTNGVLTPVV